MAVYDRLRYSNMAIYVPKVIRCLRDVACYDELAVDFDRGHDVCQAGLPLTLR